MADDGTGSSTPRHRPRAGVTRRPPSECSNICSNTTNVHRPPRRPSTMTPTGIKNYCRRPLATQSDSFPGPDRASLDPTFLNHLVDNPGQRPLAWYSTDGLIKEGWDVAIDPL